MDNNTINNYDLSKFNNLNALLTNENLTSSPTSSINNMANINNINSYLSSSYIDYSKKINELKLKRKKQFGNKIKLIDWGTRGLMGSKENEVDIISYLNKKKKIDRDELMLKFNINPSNQEKQILDSIIKKNPMINIRKRDKDYLLRIKIRKIKYNKKFKNLKQAQELRNILLLYSMINDPKFILHLTKRNKISEANQKKNKNKNNTIEGMEEDNLLFQKNINLTNYMRNDNLESGNLLDDDLDFNKENNDSMPFDQLI